MEKDIMNLKLTEENLKELSPEELVDLKIKLEDLVMDLEDMLEEAEDDEKI